MLATLAIIYSIYSNSSVASLLGRISASSEDIRSAAGEIKESNRELGIEIAKLPKRLDFMDESLAETTKILKNYAGYRELEEQSPESVEAVESVEEISDNFVVSFLKKSSIRGLEVIFIAKLSLETNTSFGLEDFATIYDAENDYTGYFVAYLVACRALGLIAYTHDAKRRYVIQSVHSVVRDRVEEILSEVIEKIARSHAKKFELDEEKEIGEWMETEKNITEFFGKTLGEEKEDS